MKPVRSQPTGAALDCLVEVLREPLEATVASDRSPLGRAG